MLVVNSVNGHILKDQNYSTINQVDCRVILFIDISSLNLIGYLKVVQTFCKMAV